MASRAGRARRARRSEAQLGGAARQVVAERSQEERQLVQAAQHRERDLAAGEQPPGGEAHLAAAGQNLRICESAVASGRIPGCQKTQAPNETRSARREDVAEVVERPRVHHRPHAVDCGLQRAGAEAQSAQQAEAVEHLQQQRLQLAVRQRPRVQAPPPQRIRCRGGARVQPQQRALRRERGREELGVARRRREVWLAQHRLGRD